MAFLAVLSIGALHAEEFFRVEKPEDFRCYQKGKKADYISQQDEILMVKGSAQMFTVRKLRFDPQKKYRLSGQFKLQSGSPVQVWFGYEPLDSQDRTIFPMYVKPVKSTETELSGLAGKGDKVIQVKDAAKWNAAISYGYIAFNVKEDYSDLPNFQAMGIAKNGIRKNGNIWEITLKQPLKRNFPEGTKVRQHVDGATYIWNARSAKLKNQWTAMSGVLSGITQTNNPANKLWPGTKAVRLVIEINGKADSVTEIRNIKVEELR